jgi:hypothetical protein
MAITSVTITQDNISGSINLLSVHNPLVFLVDVVYSSSAPEVLNVGLYDDTPTLLETFACIPYSDVTGVRTFAFIANDILKGYMGSIDDFVSVEKTLEYVNGITKEFSLTFYDPATPATNDNVSFVAIHAAQQYSNDPYLESIYINEDEVYYAGEEMTVYVYFYNDADTNIITVGSGDIIMDALLDYDNYIFVDFDDIYLIAS